MTILVVNSKPSLVFKVTKQEPELITPASPTPYVINELSGIDRQKDLLYFVPGIQIYRSCPFGQDPIKVIKEALGKALVPYYPLAGRLRENGEGKLELVCNGEGIMFIEASADVSLAEFGEPLYPPFPCIEELLYDYSSSHCPLDHPLFVIQVTRLRCGGLVYAHKFNHNVLDGGGYAQFMSAVTELARGAEFLSVEPVWMRHLITARNPPKITCAHPEYADVENSHVPFDDVVHEKFFFGPSEIASLRRSLPTHVKSSTTFEVLMACIWRSRTIALQFKPNDEVQLRLVVNARHKFNPPLPKGYYGNTVATPLSITTANNLASNPIEYALDLIKNAKSSVTEEYLNSLVDFLQINDEALFYDGPGSYAVSDVSRIGLQWDFGWGNAVFGGPANLWFGAPTPGFGNYLLPCQNDIGENGIMVPMWLPRLAMGRFIQELDRYLNVTVSQQVTQ